MAASSSAHHVAMFCSDGPGHINPLLHLSKLLLEHHDFNITFLLTEFTLSQRRSSLELSCPKNITFIGIPDGRPEAGFKSPGEKYKAMDRMQIPVEETLRNLDPPVTVIISDEFIGWMQDVANNLNVPRVCFWAATTECDIVCSHIPELISKGYLPVKKNMQDTSLITFMPGIPAIRRTDLPLCFYDDAPVLHVLDKSCRRTKEAICVLANTIEELEPLAVSGMQSRHRYFPVGPLISPSLLQDEPLSRETLSKDDLGCLEWLDQQSPSSILYVAFGSVAVLSRSQVEYILQALEDTKRRYLWVLRPNFVVDAPQGFMEDIGKRVKGGKIVGWAPQTHVLRHAAVSGFLTHCGWNSLMEGVASGVPMLAWPCTSEQNMNAKLMVEKWKIALEVHNEGLETVVDDQKIGIVLKSFYGDYERIKKNVTDLRDLVRRCAGQGGSSNQNVISFVELITSFNSKRSP